MNLFPNTEKFDGIPVSEPIRYEKIAFLDFQHITFPFRKSQNDYRQVQNGILKVGKSLECLYFHTIRNLDCGKAISKARE